MNLKRIARRLRPFLKKRADCFGYRPYQLLAIDRARRCVAHPVCRSGYSSSSFRELTRPLAPELVRSWVENRPDWVTIREASPITGYPDIDEGEAEAITLAKELDATLLCDDLAGRKAAHQEGVAVSGTLGVLQAAHLRSLLNIDQALDALSLTSFRRADGLFERLREQTLRLEQQSDQQ